MQVPVYQRQVNQNVVQPTAPSPAAFGTQVNEANQQLGNVTQKLGQLVQQRVLERQEEKDTEQVIASETAYKKEISSLRMKYENRKLSAAYDVTKDFDTEAAKVKNKYLELLPGERQKVVFGQRANAFHNSNLDYMAKYERQETNKSKINTLNDSAATSAAIIANDPSKLQDEIKSNINNNNVVYQQMGYKQEDISRENDRVKTNLISTSIGSYLQSNQLDKAKQQFEDNKELIFKNNPEGYYKIQDAIEKGDFKLAEDKIKFNISNAANIQDEKSFNLIITDNNNLINSLNLTDEAKVNLKRQYADVAITEQTNTKINIQKDIDGATKFFAKHREEMSPDKAADLEIAINEKSFSLKMDSAFKTYQTYKLADGSIDMGRVYKDLESKYSGDELEKAKSEIEGRTADFEQVRDSRRNAGIVNGQNEIAGAKNYSEAFSWLKRNETGYENRDYQALLNYAQNVFNVDKNGNPRGAGSKKTGQFYNPEIYVKIKKGINDGTINQDKITEYYRSGFLTDAKFTSLSDYLMSHDPDKKQAFDYIEKKAFQFYPKDKAKRNRFIDYYDTLSKNKKLPDVITMVENGQEEVGASWFDKIPKQESWEYDLSQQDKNNKLWSTYTNNLGTGIRGSMELALGGYYKSGNSINANQLADFDSKIGGLNSDTIKAIKELYNNKVPIVPETVNETVQRNREKTKTTIKKSKQQESSLAAGMAAAYTNVQNQPPRRY
jgi:hypothetical protein